MGEMGDKKRGGEVVPFGKYRGQPVRRDDGRRKLPLHGGPGY